MRNEKGQFIKGHKAYGKGKSKWGFGMCRCGKNFKIVKKENGRLKKFCSKICSRKWQIIGHRPSYVMSDDIKKKVSKGWIKKGSIPWNKGKQTGFAPWRGKKMLMISGENHHNWRGGVTPEHERLRRTGEYKEWRKSVFKRDNYTCMICKKRGGDIHADHVKPFALFPQLRTKIKNGRTLCVSCHKKTETYGYNAIRKK